MTQKGREQRLAAEECEGAVACCQFTPIAAALGSSDSFEETAVRASGLPFGRCIPLAALVMLRQGIVSRVRVCPVCRNNDCVEDHHCSCCVETSGELSDNAVDEREMAKRGFISFM